jgi:hemoglobin
MTRNRTVAVLLLTALLSVGVIAEAKGKKAAAKADTLFNRLGGKKTIVAVMDDFVGNCVADTRINKFFAVTAADPKRLAKFKGNLVDQLCEASGGPCKYKGKDMKAAHAGMRIGEADFNALVEDLVKSLDKFKVAEADKNALLGVLGPMKSDIVEERSAQAPAPAGAPKAQ